MDKETQKIESDRQLVYEFVKSDNWRVIKKKIIDKIFYMDSVTANIDLAKKSNEEIGELTRINAKVVNILLEWLREVEGDASLQTSQAMLQETKEDNFIIKID